jgi:hypothetical protein
MLFPPAASESLAKWAAKRALSPLARRLKKPSDPAETLLLGLIKSDWVAKNAICVPHAHNFGCFPTWGFQDIKLGVFSLLDMQHSRWVLVATRELPLHADEHVSPFTQWSSLWAKKNDGHSLPAAFSQSHLESAVKPTKKEGWPF